MSTWVALLRGVGGGIRTLPMKPLKAKLDALGLAQVRTYIQTGNVVFQDRRGAAALGKLIGQCIAEHFGFELAVMVVSARELEQALANNPFPQAQREPKSLHLFFLARAASAPDLEAMKKLKAPTEDFVLKNKILYLYTPKGFGVSKLAARVERLLGVDATARNLRTATKLLEMVSSGS
jgi:uncharacterized protein (DUF1697 family)